MGSGGNLPVGPGLWGFIAAFVLALALWLLMRNMNSRMRRMAYRERERLEREQVGEGTTMYDTNDMDDMDDVRGAPGAVPGPDDREADTR